MSTKTLGRPRLNPAKKKRRLSVSITKLTKFQIIDWNKELPLTPKRHPGLVVDRLVEHGKATDFNPAKK